MTSPNEPQEQPTVTGETAESGLLTSGPNESMQEFYRLQEQLLIVTAILTGIIFVSVWITYSLNIALNYLLGACTGVVYLRMLAKDVERIGREKRKLSSNRLALFIGLIVVATRWRELQIMPIFLGFLTYKAALIVYVLKTTLLPDQNQVS